ncbi:MAG: hypothetical protein WKF34_01645 [Pyrinomonadaceae bacterium]
MKSQILIVTTLCIAVMTTAAQNDALKIPAEVAPFVEVGTKAIAIESADLNNDGSRDFILVLEKEKPALGKYDLPERSRPLLILTRAADGKLALAARNELVVLCKECGGVFGDPFEGVRAGRGTFTVDHYGGSNWRWKIAYRFNYSRRDKTWQLVRVDNLSYHTSNPNKMKTEIETPPRHFGKVGITEFDPETYSKKKKSTE